MNETYISILSVIHDTMVDGPGFRTSIYCAGCPNHCPGCHNPQSWDIGNGRLTPISELLDEVKSDPFANVTFTGGDPMMQAESFTALARAIRRDTTKTIWCFTGFLFEHLLQRKDTMALLREIDVLVDGPYIEAQRDADLLFRGSGNQRLIDVPSSLKQGDVILVNEDDVKFLNR